MEELTHYFKWRTFIELMTFFIAFAYGLSETVLTDEILLKTCDKVLGENSTDCSSLSSSTSLQEIVQPRATTILALKSFIENFIPGIVCIIIGPRTDKIGRKPILLLAVSGIAIYYASLALLSYFNVDAYWYLAVSFITSFSGGFPMVIMSCYCYATDIASDDDKFRRLNFVDLAVIVGKLVGCFAYPPIVKRSGHYIAFTVSSVSCILALIFTGFFLEETSSQNSTNQTTNNSVFDNCRTQFVKTLAQMFKCLHICFYVFFALRVVALQDDHIHGTSTTLYLFAQQFQWTLFDYSIYTVVYFVNAAVLLLVLSSKFIKRIPCNNFLAMTIGFLSNVGSTFTRAFAKSSTNFTTAMIVGAFSWIPTYTHRKFTMKCMPLKDLRRSFTIMTALERIALSFIIPLNIYLCTNFITTHPHPVWLIQIALQVVVVVSICGVALCSFIVSADDGDD